MDVCKCIVPLLHGDTLNSRRAASPLVGLVEGEGGGRPLAIPKVFYLKIDVEPSQIVLLPAWCSKLRIAKGVNY
ncbi:hypothetical protein TNCV_3314531 [Trichonephila clavipes]|nr:hypothetical protein TNCV_3314531 [Trichonephila clavipes]